MLKKSSSIALRVASIEVVLICLRLEFYFFGTRSILMCSFYLVVAFDYWPTVPSDLGFLRRVIKGPNADSKNIRSNIGVDRWSTSCSRADMSRGKRAALRIEGLLRSYKSRALPCATI